MPTFVALVVLVGAIGLIDYATGIEISFSVFYVIPIALAGWHGSRRNSFALSFLSAAVWLLADLQGGRTHSHPGIPYWNASVRLNLFLIISYMIVLRKRAEQRILELAAIKSEFTAMVSHEIRTPLTCIREGIDMLAEEVCGPLNAKQSEHLGIAKRNVARLGRLLDDVLNYQKLEAGRMDYYVGPCDINGLVDQVSEEFALSARKRGLQLSSQLDRRLPPVACDGDKITLVLNNLVHNAIKFSERGSVVITTAWRGDAVHITVADQGIGIDPQQRAQLFESFAQLHVPGQSRPQGTGLGLAIARKIVEHHAGQIGVESQPGIGSTFFFTLPAGSAAPPGAKARDIAA